MYTQEDYRTRNKDVGRCSYKGGGIDADTNKIVQRYIRMEHQHIDPSYIFDENDFLN